MCADSSVAFSKKVIITSPEPVTKEDFIKKISEIAKNILKFLKKSGCKKLGHLKLISTTDGEDYLQLTVLEISQKPKITGILHKTFKKIKITLNIIVFGIDKEAIENLADKEIDSIQEYFNNPK